MKRHMICTAVLTLWATATIAQPVQTGVVGNTNDPIYPLEITADNGVTYKCKEQIKTVNGKPVRECQRGGGGTVFGAGTAAGIGLLPGAVGAVVGLGLIASDSNGGTSTTTTGN